MHLHTSCIENAFVTLTDIRGRGFPRMDSRCDEDHLAMRTRFKVLWRGDCEQV